MRAQQWVCVPLILLAWALGLTGCERDGQDITVYAAPKEPQRPIGTAAPAPAAPAATAPTGPQTAVPIHWAAPAGWKPLPASQMRYATFAVNDQTPPLLLTVTPLGPEAGAVLPNVNRWEGQLGLPPSSQADLAEVVRRMPLADSSADMVDLTGPAQPGQPQQRMLAAIVPGNGRVWFFKLTGPAQEVAAQKDSFDAFIRSVHFGEGAPAPAAQ